MENPSSSNKLDSKILLNDQSLEKDLLDICNLVSFITKTKSISLCLKLNGTFKPIINLKKIDIDYNLLEHTINSDKVYILNQITENLNFIGIPIYLTKEKPIGCIYIIDYNEEIEINQEFIYNLSTISNIISKLIESSYINKTNTSLEKTLKAKDEFICTITHELRTPLNAIYGFTEVIEKTELKKDQRECISVIKGSIEIMISIINEILDFSKLECGKLMIENKPFDLKQVLNNINLLHKPRSMEKGINLIFDIDDNIPEKVIGDKCRLNQILMNLIGNALKFTKRGSVYVKCNLIDSNDEFNEIKFSVKDTGIGIAQEKLESIFERFEQASSNTFRKYGGSGLGLNISKKLVELQDGHLKANSQYGHGSEFFFSIKYYKNIEFDLSFESESLDNSFSNISDNISVLVCEDANINIILLEKILAIAGYHVEIAENGKIGIEKLKNNKYDIVLMDLNMPEMNGFEATDIIRNNMNLDIPIVAMTANNCENEKKKCLNIGMNHYISKPFKQDDLFATINKFLKPRRTLSCRNGFKALTCSLNSKFALERIRIVRSNKTFSCGKVSELFLKELEDKMNVIKSNSNKDIHTSFDIEVLKTYSGDDYELEKELIEQFMKEFSKNVELLLEYIKDVDYYEIKRLAHKMKSSVLMFGLYNLNSALTQIENYCEAMDILSIQANYVYIKTIMDNILLDLNSFYNLKYSK